MSMQEVNNNSPSPMLTIRKPTEPTLTQYLADKKEWFRVSKYLKKAVNRPPYTHSLNDVYKQILNNEAHLWAGKKSAVVTVLQENPIGIFQTIWLAGGDLKELKKIEEEIVAVSKLANFKSIIIVGRKGWIKALDGYNDIGTLMEKKL